MKPHPFAPVRYVLVLLLVLAASFVKAQTATVSTEELDYPPGGTVIISGSGFQPGESVKLQVLHHLANGDNDTSAAHQPWIVIADSLGNLSSSWYVPTDEDEIGATLLLTADGLSSLLHAETTFTDANGSGNANILPSTICSASTGNELTISFRSVNGSPGTYGANSQAKITIPAGWTTPQTSNPANPGYVSAVAVGIATTGALSISGSGPWIVSFNFTCSNTNANGFDFKYGGGGTKVTAPSSGTYTFTTQTAQNQNTVFGTTGGSQNVTVVSNVTPSVNIVANPNVAFCAGSSVIYTANASNLGGGTVSNYNFKVNNISVQSSTSNSYTTTTIVNNDVITCVVTITGGTCLTSTTATSNTINAVVNPLPTIFNVAFTGSLCGTATVTLSGTETGVNYALQRNGATVETKPGTGTGISFSPVTTTGTYTIVATNTTTGCTSNMSGSVNMGGGTPPSNVFSVTGGGAYCSGGAGVPVGLSGSETGVTYQLFLGVTPVGSPVTGTGSALTFGNQTAAGIYSVVGTKTSGGCTATMTGSVSVSINTAPVITTTYSNITINNDADQCGAIVNYTAAAATGTPTPTITYSTASGSLFPIGTTTVTVTATNVCGTDTKTFTVTVNDTQAPLINGVGTDATINCPAIPTFSNPTVSDNCPGASLSFADVTTPGSCTGAYSVKRTWTATDASNNTSTASQTITVVDVTAPNITKAAVDQTVECDGSGNTASLNTWLANHGGATANDECSSVTWSNDFTSLSDGCGSTGSATVIFTVTDACGNTSTTSATFTIIDTQAPSFVESLPSDATVECNAVPTAATLTANDNCGSATVSYGEVRTDGDCPNRYTLTRTWTATDQCGNKTTHTQVITVQDTQAPTFNESLPSDATVECNAVPTAATLTANDNCGSATVSYGEVRTDGDCPNRYTLTRTWTATDQCGNKTTHTQVITVQDTQAPNFVESLPINTTVECNAVPVAEVLTATDNCGSATVSYGEVRTDGDCPNRYTLTRTWTATDQCGNKTTHTQVITVQDTQAPNFVESLPINTTVECNAVPVAEVLTATDNCGSATVSYGEVRTDGDCPNRYTLTRTWTATDQCGNKTTHTQVITVQDTQAPNFVESLPINTTVECNAVPVAEVLTATDNCGSATVSYGEVRTDGDCPNRYTLTRTWTATDQCGNKTTHTQVITVQDTQAPTFNESLPINTTVECNAVPVAEVLTATDNCGSATVSYGEVRTDGDCPNRYTLTRTWTATDQCGNKTTHTQVITVQDTQAPNFVESLPINTTVECNAVPVAEVLTATDNCGTATVSYGEVRTDGDCPNRYTLTRTWTATDQCGNKTTHTQVITVQDTQAPSFVESLPINATVECNAVPTAATLTANDNCGSATVSYGEVRTDGDCPNRYTLTRTWTATDQCGNKTTHTQVITVQDTQAPTFNESLPINTTVECNAVPVAGVLTATDNCGTATVSYGEVRTDGDCPNRYTLTRTWTATDACGNKTTHTQVITVQDTQAPTFNESLPINTTVECNAVPTAATLTANDNCGSATVSYGEVRTDGDCPNRYTLTRTWTATDQCGNKTTHTQVITVQDTQAPNFVESLPINTTVECNAVPTAATLTANDNCGSATVSYGEVRTDGDCPNRYTLTRTWTATDQCGNKTTHTQVITVQDTQAPNFVESLPINTTVECNAVPVAEVLTATDNCGSATVSYGEVRTDGDCPNRYTLTRTWTATDACGNKTTHIQVITVQDTEAPTISSVPAAVTVKCTSAVPAFDDASVAANDNCSGTVTISHLADIISNQTCANRYTITRTYVATDACGNSSTATQVITVYDDVAPVISSVPAAVTVKCTSAVPAFDNASVVANDNCSGTVTISHLADIISNQTCANRYTITRTYVATDACGNSSTATQVITVYDDEAPIATAKNVTVTLGSSGMAATTAAAVNNGSSDNCTDAGSLVLSLSKSSFDCSNIGANTVILTVTDACGNSSTASAIITVQPFAGATTSVTVSAAQYSDNATFTATIKNGVFSNCNNTQAATQVSFYIGAQFMGTANLSVNGTDLVGSLTTPLLDLANSSELNPCAGSKQVKAVFSGLNNAFSLPNNGEAYCSYTVAKEDASANYTGTYVAAIPTSSSTTAPVTLSATIKDAADSYPGDIRKARVMFVVKDYNNSAIVYSSPWFTPSLINAGDNTVGTVLANWDAPYNSTDPTKNKFYISVLVDCNGTYGYYKGAADITILYVINPCDASVNGGGYIVESNSAGTYAAEAGTQTNYGFNVKYQKNKGYQGDFNCILRQPSTGKQYQIKSTSIKTLVTGGTKSTGLKGSFTAVANVYDISNPSIAPVLLSQNNNLTVTLKDNGEPGTNDVIGITLLSSGGSLLFSSNWDGTATAEQLIGGGNLQVQNGCSTQLTTGSTVTAMKTTVVDDLDPAATRLFVAKIGPNPSEGEFRVQVQSSLADPVKLMIVDISGRLVKEMTVMPYQTLPFGNTLMKGTYFLHMIQGKDHKTYKLIKL